jgi:uncharacterized membrane protein (DUF106 family)
MDICKKAFKKVFLFIKKNWFIIGSIVGVSFFVLIKILTSDSSTKDELQEKADKIKKENDAVVKDVNKEIKKIDKEIEKIKKDREETIKRKKDRDNKANNIFNVGD